MEPFALTLLVAPDPARIPCGEAEELRTFVEEVWTESLASESDSARVLWLQPARFADLSARLSGDIRAATLQLLPLLGEKGEALRVCQEDLRFFWHPFRIPELGVCQVLFVPRPSISISDIPPWRDETCELEQDLPPLYLN
jgi:hypothetical protein